MITADVMGTMGTYHAKYLVNVVGANRMEIAKDDATLIISAADVLRGTRAAIHIRTNRCANPLMHLDANGILFTVDVMIRLASKSAIILVINRHASLTKDLLT